MPLLSLRTVDPLPLPQYLLPGPLGKDKVMLQSLCHPSVLLLPASPTAHSSEATDLSLKALTHSCGQRILADSGRGLSWGRPPSGPEELGGDDGAPPGKRNSPSPEPLFLSLLSGPLLQPEMCSRPLRAGSKMLTTFSPPNSRTKPFSLSPRRSWGGRPLPPLSTCGSQEAGTSAPWGLGSPSLCQRFPRTWGGAVALAGPQAWPPQHSSYPLWGRDSKPRSL